MEAQPNELLSETSPYLLQHAYNPVQWHAWKPENLEAARKAGRPLLISIGYSSCHWCHVMEHESFEDAEVAAYMNTHFYCIKVDREERPDVDELYMSAANLITGRGGWPLNCFAFPDGSPFHAGTYYPKDHWLRVMEKVVEQYSRNTEALRGYAHQLLTGIRLQESALTDVNSGPLRSELVDEMVGEWKNSFDPVYGGLRGAPKFPLPVVYPLLMRQAERTTDPELDRHVQLSLDHMALSGIYDQLGGGFCRYSTDSFWKVPHFEKMLYDNAQLLEVYALAYRRYGKPLYKEIMEGILSWLDRELRDPGGLYYAALDADSEGEEGKYYLWTLEQLEAAVGADMDQAKRQFDLSVRSHWEHGRYVLQRPLDHSQLSQEEWIALRARLLQARQERLAPGLDHKCLSSWNGLLMTGLCEAYRSTGDERYVHRAEQIAEAIYQHLMVNGSLLHTYTSGKPAIDGLLEDYAYLGWGLLQLYEISGKIVHFQRSQELAEAAIQTFYQSSNGLFYAHRENELPLRSADRFDNVTPATQAVAFRWVLRLGLLLGRPPWIAMAEQAVSRVQGSMHEHPAGHAYWAQLHLDLSTDLKEVVIVGSEAGNWARTVMNGQGYDFFVVQADRPEEVAFLQGRFQDGSTLAYVCHHGRCEAPITSLDQLKSQLKTID